MTNIVTAITFTVIATNWHQVQNLPVEVQVVEEQQYLGFGTNTFLLTKEWYIGPEKIRAVDQKPNIFFTTNYSTPNLWWWTPGVVTTNAVLEAPDVKLD